jgi:hypothetical protein
VTLGDSSDTFVVTTGAKLDINGTELILDADADTSITADTDDQIDIRIAGADDFRFTANSMNVLSGSTLTIDSGATITNSGTATGFADLTAIGDGTVGSPSIANSGDTNTGVYFPAADTVGVVAGGTEQFRFGSNPIPGGSKNMLINGAMTVNQRGSTTATVNTENLDRFASTLYNAAGSAVATVTKDSDSPTGFGSSMKFDVTTIATGGGDYNHVRQRIEGQNLQHLKYGTADALTCTFSFWFKTTITGIYSAIAFHMDATQTYVREFTVASADTWEFFQVTFPGYTATAFDNDANASLEIGIVLASDSATASSNNVWQAGGDTGGSTNQVNGLSSTSNNIYTTGWQFEVGDIATDFAHEDIATTLQKCQRYFWRATDGSVNNVVGAGVIATTTIASILCTYPVPMRTTPTQTDSTPGQFYIYDNSGAHYASAVATTGYENEYGMMMNFTTSSVVVGNGAVAVNVGAAILDFSAEI